MGNAFIYQTLNCDLHKESGLIAQLVVCLFPKPHFMLPDMSSIPPQASSELISALCSCVVFQLNVPTDLHWLFLNLYVVSFSKCIIVYMEISVSIKPAKSCTYLISATLDWTSKKIYLQAKQRCSRHLWSWRALCWGFGGISCQCRKLKVSPPQCD